MAVSTIRIREKLQDLNCPYLDSLDDVTTHELLLSHGQARIRLLEWLIESAVPGILQRPIPATKDHVAKLTLLFSELQLCMPQDHDLIKGTASTSKCIKFLEGLTDLVTCAIKYRSSMNENNTSISQDMAVCCYFVDDLCYRHGNLTSVIPSDITLIPPAINHAIRGGANQSVPSLAEINDRISTLTHELSHNEVMLQEMTDREIHEKLLKTNMESGYQSLQVSLTTLNQLIDNFLHCYNVDIKQWINSEENKVNFDSLGPTANLLASYLSLINELLVSIDKLTLASNSLISLKKEKLISERPGKGRKEKSLYDEIHSNFEIFIESPNLHHKTIL